ncbi:MAG: glutathione-disulfide reductase [Deltaproteobacteria bacterium]|nr:glutathione-disulfide reductase [Deltaproteobacteria bacterium]
MDKYDYDLFVIGAGSGGIRAARMAAALGVKVAVAEQSKAGGTCVNLGCVPKKLYVHAAEFASAAATSAGFGWTMGEPQFTWSRLRDNKSSLIAQSNVRMEAMLADSGAQLIHGRARVISPHAVTVDNKIFTSERILIATGGRPYLPAVPGIEHLLTSDQIFDLDQLPEQLLIIGGGYIACEFAGIFHNLGVKVTQIYRGELFLRGFDVEIRQFIAARMRLEGIDLRFTTNLKQVDKTPEGQYMAQLTDGSTVTTDLILAATGRRPNCTDLGLESLGVEINSQSAISVDDCYQTSVPSIYALGDVIDRMQLTPVALAEAMTLVKNLYEGTTSRLDYKLIPTAVFSLPALACIGLTEEQASEEYPHVNVFTTKFRALKHALTGSQERIFMKLLVDGQTDRVIGAHMAGEGAAETIQGIAVALKAGATKSIFDQTIGIHPTSAEEFVTMRSITRSHRH